MTNLVERMAKRIAKSCPWLPINGEYKVAEYALEVVLQDIEEAVRPLRERKEILKGYGVWMSFNNPDDKAIDQTLSNIDEMKGEGK